MTFAETPLILGTECATGFVLFPVQFKMLFLMLLAAVWLKHFHEAYVVSFYNNVISFHEKMMFYDVVGLKIPLSLMVVRRLSNFFEVFLVKQIQLIYLIG